MNTPLRSRAIGALLLASVALLVAGSRALHEPAWPTDFDQLWHAARALVSGVDPYSVVGPVDRPFKWLWPLYYPLPAVLVATPLSFLPVVVARVTFATVAAGVLGWTLGRRLLALWPLALSAAFLISVTRTQWSPLLLAACWSPALAWVVTAKPNVGLAALVVHERRREMLIAAAGIAIAVVVSFLARPDWFASWRAAIADSPHISPPIARPFGFLLALAALKWRRADARLVLVMACVPHTPSLYDLLPLFFICRSLRESLLLALLTQALFWGFVSFGSGDTFDQYAGNLGRAIIWVVYLPVLAAILARPNVHSNASSASPTDTSGHTWRNALPANAPDALLSVLLIVAGFLLAWVPLVTTRSP